MNKKQANFWAPYITLIGDKNFQINGELVKSKFYTGIDASQAAGDEYTVNSCIWKYNEYNQILEKTVILESDLNKIFGYIVDKNYFDEELIYLHSNYQVQQTIKEHWDLIISCWRRQEFNTSSKKRKDNWKKIFALRETIPSLTDQLPDTFTAYRAGNPDGFSWTLNKEQAIWFHNRFKNQFGNIPFLQNTFDKKDVVFYTDGRREQEVVILTK